MALRVLVLRVLALRFLALRVMALKVLALRVLALRVLALRVFTERSKPTVPRRPTAFKTGMEPNQPTELNKLTALRRATMPRTHTALACSKLRRATVCRTPTVFKTCMAPKMATVSRTASVCRSDPNNSELLKDWASRLPLNPATRNRTRRAIATDLCSLTTARKMINSAGETTIVCLWLPHAAAGTVHQGLGRP